MSEEPSWELYRTFLSVFEQGSLSGAARDLGITQPTVGRHVDALEGALGDLFTRSQTGLMPTELARDLVPYASALAATSASLLRTASGRRDVVAGTVRLSASEVIAVEVLPPLLAELHDAHPQLQLELSASDRVEDLLHREADIAVRMTEPVQEALVVRRIGGIPIGMFANARYLQRHSAPRSIADLAEHRIIGYDRQSAYVRAMSKKYPVLGALTPSFRTDSNLGQLAAIRAGIGIGLCQVGVVADEPDIVRVLSRAFEFQLETFVAMHENLRTSPRCRVVFDALVTKLGAYVKSGRKQ